jgi:tRNA (cytidine/uridine-2'-O-)-methyltransferase
VFDVVLFEPEIPANTGNVARLTANMGARLHLIRPLGFSLTDKAVRRAGMDYLNLSEVKLHDDWVACAQAFTGRRIFCLTTKGVCRYDEPRYHHEDVFVFGPESRGLPESLLSLVRPECRVRIPMVPGSRSLNLSNAVAITCFEAWRQLGFSGIR